MSVASLCGTLLACMIVLSVSHSLTGAIPAWPAGALGWAAGLLLIPRLRGLQRLQVLAMLTLGGSGLLWGLVQGSVRWLQALTANHALLSMLAGVSFLRLISAPLAGPDERLPRGRSALWRTLLGLHLFGAVINLSALIIVGERMSGGRPLSRLQAIVLSRGFSAAALWSPFFAAMGVALTYAPGADLARLCLVGLPLAMLAIGYTAFDRDGAGFVGYPIHFEALWIPALLALAVLTIHELRPALPIIAVVTVLSVTLVFAMLLLREGGAGIAQFRSHIRDSLPRMSSELTLFLSAGVMAAGIGSVMDAADWDFAVADFGPGHAAVLLATLIGLAVAGVHPVIGISTVGPVLVPQVSDPSLLGMTFLMGWGLGVTAAPLSGMNLAIQSRFGVRSHAFVRWNAGYVAAMYVVAVIALFVYRQLVD